MEPYILKVGPQGQVQYRLVFDNAAAFSFEEGYRREFGREKGLFELMTECAECYAGMRALPAGEWRRVRTPSLTEISLALWALAHHHSKGRPSLEKIRSEVNAAEILEYVLIVATVIAGAMPKAESAEDADAAEGKGKEGSAPLGSTPNSSG